MSTEDFEKRLQRQPLRKIPDEWRAEILQKAEQPAESPFVIRHSFLSALLWPNPKAWLGLGAVWILIFALQAASRGPSMQVAHNTKASTSEIVLNWRNQQKLLAELINNNPVQESDRPKRNPNQPHSERRETAVRV